MAELLKYQSETEYGTVTKIAKAIILARALQRLCEGNVGNNAEIATLRGEELLKQSSQLKNFLVQIRAKKIYNSEGPVKTLNNGTEKLRQLILESKIAQDKLLKEVITY